MKNNLIFLSTLILAPSICFSETPAKLTENHVSATINNVPVKIVSLNAIEIKDQVEDQNSPDQSYIIVDISGTYETHGTGEKKLGLEFIRTDDRHPFEYHTYNVLLREVTEYSTPIEVFNNIVPSISVPKPFKFHLKITPGALPYKWSRATSIFKIKDGSHESKTLGYISAQLENKDGRITWDFYKSVFENNEDKD